MSTAGVSSLTKNTYVWCSLVPRLSSQVHHYRERLRMRVIKYARFCIFATVLYMMMAHKPVQVAAWLKSTLPESNLDFSGSIIDNLYDSTLHLH